MSCDKYESVLHIIADGLMDQFEGSDAVNYIEQSFENKDDTSKSFVLTMQMKEGLTPCEKLAEAEKRIEQLTRQSKRLLTKNDNYIERIEQLELDSARWNAFINSPFRLFGYAGLDHEEPNRPCQELGVDGFAHFGCEMWTKHSGWKPGDGKNILIGFADQAIVANGEG